MNVVMSQDDLLRINLPPLVVEHVIAKYPNLVVRSFTARFGDNSITGGGIKDNLPRTLPDHCIARLDPEAWVTPQIFEYLVERGDISLDERYRVFNMGVGFVIVVAEIVVTTVQDVMIAQDATTMMHKHNNQHNKTNHSSPLHKMMQTWLCKS